MRPLSIGFLSDDFLPAMTGVGIHLQALASELVCRGHHVFIITSKRSDEPVESDWNGVHIYRLPTIKIYGFYQAVPTLTAIKKIFSHEHPDIIHHHYLGFMMMQGYRVAHEQNLPQISTYHFSSAVLTAPPLMRPFKHWIESKVHFYNNHFTALLVPSQTLLSELRKTGIQTPMHHISNWVTFDETQICTTRTQKNIFTILFVGRLAPEKNLSLLLRSLQQIIQTNPDVHLQIIGDGPMREALEKECVSRGIADYVHFLGFLKHAELPRYYTDCDVFVLPSKIEAQSIVAIEALWFGKPVIITTAIPSASEIVSDGMNGYIVDADDETILTQKILTLTADSNLLSSMGKASKEQSKQYRPETIIDSIENIYYHSIKTSTH